MSSGEESNREEELAIVNLENVKRISETYQPRRGKGKNKKGTIPKSVVQEIWKDRLSPRFYSRLMSVMFPEESNEVSFLSFYTIYKNLTEPETEIMFRALTIYHIATIHEPPFNYETANEYPNASYKAIKDYVCDVITSYLHATINFNMKEAHAWLGLKASNTLIDGNLAASYVLKDLETHRNEVSIGSLEIWLEKNEIYYTVSEQLYLFLFGVNSYANVKPLIPLPVVQTSKVNKTLLALPDVLLLNSKLRKRAQRWTLAYILDRHSQNWETLKQAIYGKGQTIIVIQDANGDIFGMYGSQRWVPAEGFFGNDECFLFTLKPDVNIYEGSGRDNNFQLFNESGIGMGGTEDKPGLLIQSDTVKGKTSLACRTFRAFWPLAKELEFKICQMEIWTVAGDETKVEEDVRDLICNTQYMKMRGDEVYNETKRADPLNVKQQRIVQDRTINNPPETQGVTRCYGQCAMDMLKSQPKSDPRPKYNQQRVCCSKRCLKKIKVSSRDRNGEGDGNIRVHAAHKVPCQEEEKIQRHHKYSVEEVNIKRENDRRPHRSFDARQKHGADGFIHPSLAAEENERNAKEAAEAAKKNETESNNQTKKHSNKIKPSKKRRFSNDSSQKSYSPSGSYYTQTACNIQTQVGESRLMKPTCRAYRHSNKCSCVVKTTCACPPKESGNDKTMVTSSQARFSETSNKSKKSNSNRPTSKVSIETEKSDLELEDNNVAPPEKDALRNKPKSPTKNEKEKPAKKSDREAAVKIRTSSMEKSEASSKQPKGEKSRRGKQKQNDTLYSMSNYSYPMQNPVEERAKGQDVLSQDLMLPELDCRCSSESDSAAEEVAKKCNPAFTCSCETKLSKYLTKTKDMTITDISLTDISSSVCSCILDNKKITIASQGLSATLSVRETQNPCKSRRKSDGSAHSNQITTNDMKNLRTRSPICISSKKETQLHLKSRRVGRKSADVPVPPNKQAMPPTCLRCNTQVGQRGCQCKLRSVFLRKKMTARETQNLTNSRRYSESSSASETVSNPVIKDHQSAMEKESRKRNRPVIIGATASVDARDSQPEHDSGSLLGSESSRNYGRSSSHSFQTKSAPKRTCEASCKCSLSPSYFPVFPEDLIKEDTEDCDCASYNDLRFPVIVETPPLVSREPSIKSPTVEPEKVQEPPVEELKQKKCGCDDNDNTIIILNVSKCDTAETVEKLIHDLEEKAGDPKIKSLLFKCKDLTESKSPYSTKNETDREALRQYIEKILRKNNPPAQPGQEEHPIE